MSQKRLAASEEQGLEDERRNSVTVDVLNALRHLSGFYHGR